MPDITMCDDKTCPMRGKCYRYLAIQSTHRQSYFMESPRDNEKCDYFLAVQQRQRINEQKLCDEKWANKD